MRAGVVVCVVLAFVGVSPVAHAAPPGRARSRLPARVHKLVRIYRVSLHDTVRHGRGEPAANAAVALTVNVLGGALALDRPVLTPLAVLAGLAFSSEALSVLGWRDGRLDRPRGWLGAPFRALTRAGVGVAVVAGVPPMRRISLLRR